MNKTETSRNSSVKMIFLLFLIILSGQKLICDLRIFYLLSFDPPLLLFPLILSSYFIYNIVLIFLYHLSMQICLWNHKQLEWLRSCSILATQLRIVSGNTIIVHLDLLSYVLSTIVHVSTSKIISLTLSVTNW